LVTSGNNRQRIVATQLATRELENIRGTAADPTKFTSITVGQTVSTKTVNGIDFTITQDVQWVGQSSTQSSCDSPGTNDGQILQVTERVSWRGMAGIQPVQQTTALAPPVGAYSASTGSIAVKVLDSSAALNQNINVQIAGPVTQSQQTTTEGCAFFPFLTPGTYTVSIIEGTGVGDQENAVPAQTTSVSVGQTASLTFNYDTGATITMTGYDGSIATPASGIRLSVANTGLQPYSQYTFGSGITSLTPLYPYLSGYTVFAGQCTDSNPLGKDTDRNLFYPTAAPTPVEVDPGGTASTTATLYNLPVYVTRLGVATAAATVTARPTTGLPAPNTVVCTNGIANTTGATLGLVATDAAGNSTTAVPLGHLTITATKVISGTTRTGTANVWVKPDGVYAVDANGAATTMYAGAIPVALT
jgi:hypothetical protein